MASSRKRGLKRDELVDAVNKELLDDNEEDQEGDLEISIPEKSRRRGRRTKRPNYFDNLSDSDEDEGKFFDNFCLQM